MNCSRKSLVMQGLAFEVKTNVFLLAISQKKLIFHEKHNLQIGPKHKKVKLSSGHVGLWALWVVGMLHLKISGGDMVPVNLS